MTHRRTFTLLAIAVLWSVSGPAIPGRAQTSDQPDNPLAAQSLERLSATRDRPLFSPSRRPVPPPPPPVEQAPAVAAPLPPPNVTLFGIVVDDEGARAIVRSGSDKVDRVQIGDHIHGWTVSQIEGRRLVLSLDGRFATFTLFSDERGKQSPGDAGERSNKLNAQVSQEASPQAVESQSPTPRRRRRSQQ
jgi:hypothetical protein